MKKNIIYLLGLSAIFLVTSVRPATAAGASVMNNSGEPEMVRTDLPSAATAGINVIVYNDGSDRVIYNNTIPAGTSIEEQFDFSKVQTGKYRLVKQLDDIHMIRILNVLENGIVLSESLYSFTPEFEPGDKILRVQFMNSPQNNVRIKITDTWETVFEDSYLASGEKFTRNYDLQSFPKGIYTYHLVSGQEEFSYNFKVE